jgi:hypothetical protein
MTKDKQNWARQPLIIWQCWNTLLLAVVLWLGIKQHMGNGDTAEGYGLIFISPVIFITLVLDLFALIHWLTKRAR